MKTTRIGIIDDNQEYCSNLLNFFQRQEDIQVDFIAKDGLEGLEKIKTYNVDIILLDIVMPKLDGFGLLECLNEDKDIKHLPQIIVASQVSQDIMVQKSLELGASYFMVKPLNLNILLKRISQLSNPNDSYDNKIKNLKPSKVKENISLYEIESMITNLLHMTGVPAHLKGYIYLKDAIKLVVHDLQLLSHITKELYPKIAELNNTTPLRVERGIRTAVLVGWDRADNEILEEIFGYTIDLNKGKPTNSEFIALLADKVRLENML